ncbi:L,D-transpeptidase family protein [Geomonas sp.]|uniref:L,D-transpeptidase family protein n=1 Tax=Geomonas sp. TaxID=2651584 RepID=UPI002B473B4A|nr:L,D-transpeptidase family protein [Geomonas sp.]HJV36542.1 L,D-transpeptidase family protein [Geomonas sp.]
MDHTCGYLGRQGVLISVLAFALLITPQLLPAEVIPIHEGFLGHLQHYQVKKKESLIEIARKFDVGFNEIMAANPGIDPFVPESGTLITIPTAWILPTLSSRPSVVINLPEFRLYYLPKPPSQMVLTFPLGIGDQGTDTPLGGYHVVEKIVKPAWHVPPSIRKKEPMLPKVMPPGPHNPMGSHALRLSSHDILIHGTNRPWGIGRRSSHGCLRLYPEDIVTLFRVVAKGTPVVIIDQPVKIGTKGHRIFLEAHRKDRSLVTVGDVVQRLADKGMLGRTDFAKLIRVMEERRGIPLDVTLDFSAGKAPAGRETGPAGQPAPLVRSRATP